MAEKPKNQEPVESDPERGDAILRRMLKSKPKPHKDMKKGKSRKDRGSAKRGSEAS
jgi:hypothetical protein